MERQRREEELKGRTSKKGQDAELSVLKRATSPQTGGSMKTMKEDKEKDKSGQAENEGQEGSGLKTAGPDGEITAGFLLKKSSKANGWSRRWFVLNEKTGKLGYTKKQEERNFHGVITLEECNIEEVSNVEDLPSKSSKDKKSNGLDSSKASLVFKITCRVPYKTIVKAHSAVVLKAENTDDKVEWINKISSVIRAKGGQIQISSEGRPTIRHSLSDGSLETMNRRFVDPEEEFRWMSQEVRGYVEAVLNSLVANVPKAIVLCLVEKAKEDMLNQLYSSVSAQSTAKIEELLQDDHNVKGRRERYQKQSLLLSKLTHQLSVHDNNRATAACNWSNGTAAENGPESSAPSNDWRSAFDAAANGPVSHSGLWRSGSNGHSQHTNPVQNGDTNFGSNSISRRSANQSPPPRPASG